MQCEGLLGGRRQRIAGRFLPSRLCSAARRAGLSLWLRCRACAHRPGHRRLRPPCAMQCRGLLGGQRHRTAGGLLGSRLRSADRRAGFTLWPGCRAWGHRPGHRPLRPPSGVQCRGLLGGRWPRAAGRFLSSRLCSAARRAGWEKHFGDYDIMSITRSPEGGPNLGSHLSTAEVERDRKVAVLEFYRMGEHRLQ